MFSTNFEDLRRCMMMPVLLARLPATVRYRFRLLIDGGREKRCEEVWLFFKLPVLFEARREVVVLVMIFGGGGGSGGSVAESVDSSLSSSTTGSS